MQAADEISEREVKVKRCLSAVLLVSMACLLSVAAFPQSVVFTALVNNQPPQIDPAGGAGNPELEFARACYETLLNADPNDSNNLLPALATAWESSADKKVWTFALRAGVTFHDGSLFDANDVKVGVERAMAIAKGESSLLRNVDRVEVLDGLTVQFVLRESEPGFAYAMTRMFIPSSEAVAAHEQNGDLGRGWLSENEAGSGPYTLVEWVRGERIVLDRFEGYWRGWDGQHVDRFVLWCVPEAATQALIMERSEAQAADNILLEDAARLQSNPLVRVVPCPGDPMYLCMNTTRGPLSNKLVREAIAYAFDYETLLSTVMGGFAERLGGPIPDNIWAANADLAVHYDLQKAKDLLAQAGYPDGGFTLEYMYFAPWLYEEAAGLMFQESLRQLGIGLTIEGQPFVTWSARATNPDLRPDFGFGAVFAGGAPTPDALLRQMYHSGSAGHWAYWGYDNPAFDHLLDVAASELDDARRATLYGVCQEMVFYDYASIYIMKKPSIIVFANSVQGFQHDPAFAHILNYYDLYLE